MKRGSSALACLVLLLAFPALGQLAPSHSPPVSREGQGETRGADDSLYNLAKAALQQGDLDGAEKCFQQSLSISEKLVPPSLAVARSLNGLGDVAQQRGMPPAAEAYYQRALAILQKLDPSGADAANSLDGLARAAFDRGDAAKSEQYAPHALTIRQHLDPNSLDLALSLNSVANVYKIHGQWDTAEESLKKALMIQEKLAPESLVLAETLKNLGRFFLGRRRYDEATTNFQRALMIRRKIAPDGLAVADSLRWLGACTRNNADEQERYYRAALAIQERLAPGSIHVALTLTALAEAEQYRGDLVAAEKDSRQALAMWENLMPDGGRSRRQMYDLAQILVLRGDLAVAEEFARRAWEGDRKDDPAGNWVGWDMALLAQVAVRRGDLVAADDYYHQALEIGERHDPGGQMSARMMGGLGFVAANREDLAKAEEYYRRALAIWGKTNPEGSSFAQGLFSVGSVIHRRGNLAQAESYYRRALAIWERVVPNSLYVAEVLGALGRLARDQRDLARAEEYQRRAIAIEQRLAPGGAALAQGLNDLGDVLLARVALPEALECHQQALAIREKLAPGTYFHAASLAAVAGIMRRQGNSDAAAQYFQQALDQFENRVARLGGGDELRAGFRAKYASYYKDYIDLLVEQKRFDLAFQVLERFRARSLLETLALARAEIRKGVDPALLQQQRRLRQSLAAKTQQRIQLLGAKSRDVELVVVDKEIQNLYSQYHEVEDQIRASSPGYAELMQPQPISAKETQEQLLDSHTLLLEYSLGEERSFVFAVTPDSLQAFVLPKRAVIEAAAQRVNDLLTAQNSRKITETLPERAARVAQAEAEYPKVAGRLRRMLLGPVASELKDRRLLIVSDGALHYVPFAALPMPAPGRSFVPLAVKHEVINLPSASVVAVLRRERIGRQPGAQVVAVFADPVFDTGDIRVQHGAADEQPASSGATRGGPGTPETLEASRETELSRSRDELTRSAVEVGWQGKRNGEVYLPRLRFTRQEAETIAAITPAGQSWQAMDFQASRANAMSRTLTNYQIVHFATHALVNNQHPELSGLVLSLVNEQGKLQNGFLSLQDIYNLDLPAELVVLSACETGLGKKIEGEGLVGFTRGFMHAGATRVVATLWKIDDRATAEMMGRFYREMIGHRLRPAAALRAAQVQMWKTKRWNSPYFWAAFQLQGEWR